MSKIRTALERVKTQCPRVLSSLPDKTKIFISALWYWTFVMFYITKVFNKMLGLVLTYTPDSFLYNPLREFLPRKNEKPVVLEARSDSAVITNKIKTLIKLKWDEDIENDDTGTIGGLNSKDIYPMLSTAVVWISYVLDTENAVSKMNDEELGKCIKHLLIDCSNNALYRTPDLKKAENILFGQIPF